MNIKEVLDCSCDLSVGTAVHAIEKFEADGKEATVLRVSPTDKDYAHSIQKLSLFKKLVVQVDETMEAGSWYIGDEKEGYGSKGA